jgi:hypothetical protein
MTTLAIFREDWGSHPLGMTIRVLIALGGLATATLLVMTATLAANGVWFLVLLGLALGVTAVRAAVRPTAVRLALGLAALLAIPLTGLVI